MFIQNKYIKNVKLQYLKIATLKWTNQFRRARSG